MDSPTPPKSPVLECVLQDPDPPKNEDAKKGQIDFNQSGVQKNEKRENESEMEKTPTSSSTTAPIAASAPTPAATPAPTSNPTQVPRPSNAK